MDKIIKLGENFEIDLDKLISTRMLIQANSGGGKSYAIRKLLEETHGQVQQIVIDLEGEFASLREKYDYLLVGPDGEIPARIQTAELLAIKLLKLNVSTIIDLSELKHHERILFVKRFINSLVNSPKELWHPCMVIVDEAHQFCPEKAKSESAGAIIDLCTRGRKRGFCAVLATQRISKLSKDAAAECNNNLVGRTMLDLDQKRAADTLGITNKDDIRNLRNMGDGEFWIFGPAIGRDVKKIQVTKTKTIHMDSKNVILSPTPTPKNIAKIMKDVIDLPKEAEDELKNINDYKNKVVDLKREVRRLEHTQAKPIIQSDEKAIERAHVLGFAESEKQWNEKWKEVYQIQKAFKDAEDFVRQFMHKGSKLLDIETPEVSRNVPQCPAKPVTISHQEAPISKVMIPPPFMNPKIRDVSRKNDPNYEEEGIVLGLCEKKIYSLLCEYPDKTFSKQQIGVFTGYRPTSGGVSSAISRLRQLNLIQGSVSSMSVLEIKHELMGEFNFSIEAIIPMLGKCEKEIYDILLKNPDEEFDKERICENTPSNYSPTSGGVSSAISRLNTFGLIKKVDGSIKLNPEMLELI